MKVQVGELASMPISRFYHSGDIGDISVHLPGGFHQTPLVKGKVYPVKILADDGTIEADFALCQYRGYSYFAQSSDDGTVQVVNNSLGFNVLEA